MKVLITGCRGRIGKRVVAKMLELGYEIIGLDIADPPKDRSFQYFRGSLEDEQTVKQAVDGVEGIIHLGAWMTWIEADAPRIFSTNVAGTFHLLHAAASQNIQRLIFASTGNVYPEAAPVYLPIDEKHPKNPTSHYGISKLLGEELVWFYARKYNIPSVVLRFAYTLDAAELLNPNSPLAGPRFFLQKRIAQARSYGQHEIVEVLKALDDGTEKLLLSRDMQGVPFRMPILDARDLADGIVQAFTSPKAPGETIGIGPDEATRFDEAVKAMHELTGIPYVDVKLPSNTFNYHTINAKARELLGFRPKWNFSAMLEEAFSVWRDQHHHSNT